MSELSDFKPFFKELRFWSHHYAHPELSDDRAISEFMESEPRERVTSLRGEVMAIKNGNYDEKVLEEVIGKNRLARHGSWEHWATLMLLWMNKHREA